MKRFIEGVGRSQAVLFPHRLDDWVAEDNPFGYLNLIQSSRRLEREAQRNVELMWLTERLAPDFKTIADFHRDNGTAIRRVCVQFVRLCRQLGLLQQALVAIDGSKFKAVDNRDKNLTVRKLEARKQQLEASVERYLAELDRADRDPELVPEERVEHLKEKIAKVRAQMKVLDAIDEQLAGSRDEHPARRYWRYYSPLPMIEHLHPRETCMPALSRRLAELTLSLLLFMTALAISSLAAAADKPPVRAITAFIDLDPARYEEQIKDTANRLRQASAVFQKAGYEVQTVRITTQPYPRYVRGMGKEQALKLLSDLAALGLKESVAMNIGPAAVTDEPDPAMLELLESVHSELKPLDATMIVASESGVHWNTVRAAARHVYRVAQKSPRSQGTFSFAATAMLGPGTPFYPGSYHVQDGGRFSIGLQSPSLVARAFAAANGNASEAARLLRAAFAAEATQVNALAEQVAQVTGWRYWGFDSTPAPLKEDSIGAAMESLHSSTLGSAGTMTAAYIITKAQADLPGPRVGYNGLMIPVLEDSLIAKRWSEGLLSIDSLLAYSSVCGTGLDTVPLPGDVTEETLARMIGDMAVLAVKWNKPLTARLQPVHGRKAGEMSEFDDPFLVNAKLQPVR